MKPSCVITLRRTLEMVCKDKGATTGQLHQKLLLYKYKRGVVCTP
ncbi:DUF4145 domain-containing protein [Thalassobacillus sp. C254]